jgi:hypothetical protein
MLTQSPPPPVATTGTAQLGPARRGRRRWVAASVTVGILLALAVLPDPAHAGDGAAQMQCQLTSAEQPCTQQPGPTATLGSAPPTCDDDTHDGECGPDYGVPGLDGCWYKLTQPTQATANAMAESTDDPGGVWYIRTCGHGPARHSTLVQLAIPPADDPATLAEHARLTLHLPIPAATVHTGPNVVGWPTWLWLDPQSWRPESTTASAGGQTATVTATPTLAVWQTGDTLAELCTGPGTGWPAGTDPAKPSPDCGHLYAQAPTDAAITVTVLWTVVASSNGTDIRLPALSTTTTIASAGAGDGLEEPTPTP